MLKTTGLLIFFLLFSGAARSEEDLVEMPLPELESQGPSSGNFVGSYEKDLGNNKSTSSQQSPSRKNQPVREEVKGIYESAFSSYKSQKLSQDQDADTNAATDEWRKGLDKPDSFDLDSLTYSEPSPQSQTKSKKRSSVSKGRLSAKSPDPASLEEIPMPEEKMEPAAPVSAKVRKEMVMKTIADNYGDLKVCFENGLKKSPEMKGKVVMGWSIDNQGHVSGVEVLTSQLNNKGVEKCMADRLANWSFPRQAKLQGNKDRMTYAFQFLSEKE
ncbi:MAG: AgmX/PglI C-terminal domain-containing protein [Pseudobdellovibrionaceae bacterium]